MGSYAEDMEDSVLEKGEAKSFGHFVKHLIDCGRLDDIPIETGRLHIDRSKRCFAMHQGNMGVLKT